MPAQANPAANAQYPKFGGLQKFATVMSAPTIWQGINNIYAQNVANAQLAQQMAGKQQLYGAALGIDPATGQQRINSMPNVNSITPEELSKIIPSVSNSDYGFNQGLLNKGGMPTSYGIAPAQQVQSQGQQINEQQSKNAAYQEWLAQQQKTFQQGQGASANNTGFIQGPKGLAGQLQPPAGMDNGAGGVIPGTGSGLTMQDGAPTLNAGAQTQGYKPQMVSPFNVGAVAPADMNSVFNAGPTDVHNARTAQESNRHNKATENLTQQIITATENNQGGYANNPSYPPQMNGDAYAYQAYQQGRITPEQYAETLGAKPPEPVVPTSDQQTYLNNLRNDANGGGFFGIGKGAPNAAATAQYNSYARHYGFPSLPFGGNPQKQSGSASSGFADWKKKKG